MKSEKESLKNTYNQIDNYLKSLKNNYDIITQRIVIARGYETDFIESINSTENIGFIDLKDIGFD
ncbi:MAG: hypothetical protein U1C19_02390 [Methanobacteriaceae archaeon]|nr:hypothetical protein [Methanobacteriaceae archaeon]